MGMSIPPSAEAPTPTPTPAFVFDLDGTLVDSVYQHVLAWREALEREGISLSVWRIHRRIGMSGGLLVNALARETGGHVDASDAEQLIQWHAEAFLKYVGQVRPLPGAVALLDYLYEAGVPHARGVPAFRCCRGIHADLIGDGRGLIRAHFASVAVRRGAGLAYAFRLSDAAARRGAESGRGRGGGYDRSEASDQATGAR